MLLSESVLGEVALKLLETLDREKILTLRDLEARVGTKIKIESAPQDSVFFEVEGSAGSAQKLVVDYLRIGSGFPIQLKFNQELGYLQSMIKCETILEGYDPFAVDQFGNIVQLKRLDMANDEIRRDELRKLSSLKDH